MRGGLPHDDRFGIGRTIVVAAIGESEVDSLGAGWVDAVSLRAGVVGDGWLPRTARAMSYAVQQGTSREAQATAQEFVIGAGSTITPRYASQLMGSWWPSGTVFPPLPVPVILDSPPSGQPRTSGHASRRVRPERHNPHSIATIRLVLARLLLRQLPHCPFCGSSPG